jgi:protein-tyrosine phosphatase
MAERYSRQINFESVINFRDLGGYKARGGRMVAWRRLFRSGELHHMTRSDFNRLTGEIRLASVIDLRSAIERERQGIGLLSEAGVKYHSVSFLSDGGDRKANEQRYSNFSNMGEFYIYLVRKREFGQQIIEALKIIAASENHPLIFHCAIGKDRTGILAAILLNILGAGDEDIITDYSLSAPYMAELIGRKDSEPEIAQAVKVLPAYFWEAAPESMALFLAELRREYGSARGYVEAQGAEPSLIERLEAALLA